jgi:small subunit ribosomal protein S6
MRVYEELFIVRPDATEEEVDPFLEQIKGIITTGGGTVEKADKWGVRKLAYRVQKRTEGLYILLQFSAGPELVKELERRLRVSDMVLKFITVRIDEKLKRIEKRKKAREKRAARRPPPQAAAPAAPATPSAPAMPAEPGVPTPGAPAPGAPAAVAPAAVVPAPGAAE